jgi:hypothetical protein
MKLVRISHIPHLKILHFRFPKSASQLCGMWDGVFVASWFSPVLPPVTGRVSGLWV